MARWPLLGCMGGLAALLLAGCIPDSSAEQCEQTRAKVQKGAICLANSEDGSPEDCDAAERALRNQGLTQHDARKIVRMGLDEFYENYKGGAFCEVASLR